MYTGVGDKSKYVPYFAGPYPRVSG